MLETLRAIQRELDREGDLISSAHLQAAIDRIEEAEATKRLGPSRIPSDDCSSDAKPIVGKLPSA